MFFVGSIDLFFNNWVVLVMDKTKIDDLKLNLESILEKIDDAALYKTNEVLSSIEMKYRLTKQSNEHALAKKKHEKRFHPVRPIRRGIYNVFLSPDSVGKELKNNHLCVIISNPNKNKFSEKVNIVPIEGDGARIDPKNNLKLTNADLEEGNLDKIPSKIIVGDIMTIDKARIGNFIGKLKNDKFTQLMDMVKDQLDIK